jgi:hypothetical protein
MIRKAAAQNAANHLLGFHVRLRHGRFVVLDRDLEITLIVTADDVGGGTSSIQSGGKKRGQGHESDS